MTLSEQACKQLRDILYTVCEKDLLLALHKELSQRIDTFEKHTDVCSVSVTVLTLPIISHFETHALEYFNGYLKPH